MLGIGGGWLIVCGGGLVVGFGGGGRGRSCIDDGPSPCLSNDRNYSFISVA